MKYNILDLHYYYGGRGKYVIRNIVTNFDTKDTKFKNVFKYNSSTTTYIVIKKCIFILVYKAQL